MARTGTSPAGLGHDDAREGTAARAALCPTARRCRDERAERDDNRSNRRSREPVLCTGSRSRHGVWVWIAEPIWASGHDAAPTGRTHDRNRPERRISRLPSCIQGAVHTCKRFWPADRVAADHLRASVCICGSIFLLPAAPAGAWRDDRRSSRVAAKKNGTADARRCTQMRTAASRLLPLGMRSCRRSGAPAPSRCTRFWPADRVAADHLRASVCICGSIFLLSAAPAGAWRDDRRSSRVRGEEEWNRRCTQMHADADRGTASAAAGHEVLPSIRRAGAVTVQEVLAGGSGRCGPSACICVHLRFHFPAFGSAGGRVAGGPPVLGGSRRRRMEPQMHADARRCGPRHRGCCRWA